MTKRESRMGRPTLYDKPHRTTIMQSGLVKDTLLPELQQWIPGCSKNDLIEKAVREFHRTEQEKRRCSGRYA